MVAGVVATQKRQSCEVFALCVQQRSPFHSPRPPPPSLSLQLHPEVSSSLSRVLLDAWRPSRFILALSRVSSLGRHGPECVRPSSRRVNFAKIAQGEYWADETAMFAAYTSSIVESRPVPA